MRTKIMVGAVIALTVLTGFTCCGRGGGGGGGGDAVGTIGEVKPNATVGGKTAGEGGSILIGDHMVTDGAGTMSVDIHGVGCVVEQNTDLSVPTEDRDSVVFNGAVGRATCTKVSDQTKRILWAQNRTLKVTAQDPVWTVEQSNGEVLVRVVDGFVTVEATAPGSTPVQIDKGFQAVFSGGVLGTPTAIDYSRLPDDEKAAYAKFGVELPTTQGTGGAGPATSEPPDVSDARVTYDFAVPTDSVTVTNPVTPPLPRLVGIYTGDHPEGSPAYQRISFYFQGAFPSYRFGFVSVVVQDGSGEPVKLDGTSILSLTFVDAQAHDDAGASTVVASPPGEIGMSQLVSYAQAGDFEGHVSFGLGLRGPDGTSKDPAIRLGQLRRSDTFVVYLDVRVS
jgi:hypothetical protein